MCSWWWFSNSDIFQLLKEAWVQLLNCSFTIVFPPSQSVRTSCTSLRTALHIYVVNIWSRSKKFNNAFCFCFMTTLMKGFDPLQILNSVCMYIYKYINGCPVLRVCVHGECELTAVCVHLGWVKCRAQTLSIGHHTWSYVTSLCQLVGWWHGCSPWRSYVASLYWRTRHLLLRFLCLHEAAILALL